MRMANLYLLTLYSAWAATIWLQVCTRPSGAATPLHRLSACLAKAGVTNLTTSSSASYTTLLNFSLQNRRFADPSVPKPAAIILPSTPSQTQSAFKCAKLSGYDVRTRSGGHSYEALSSTSSAPSFVIIDQMNLNSVTVDVASATAWAGAGATLGEIYVAVSKASSQLAFPAGVCPTIGISGHVTGGGWGFLSRKYGVAADNVLDVQIVDAAGNLLDRESLGEDVLWAVRGGGGGSFGMAVAWKLKLVAVPETVTVFRTSRSGMDNVINLVFKWQQAASSAPPELVHAVYMAGSRNADNTTQMGATFYGHYLGSKADAVAVMKKTFPELGLREGDCEEGQWIDSVAFISYWNVADLTSRDNRAKQGYFKAKSDFVRKASPLPEAALRGAFERLQANAGHGYMIFEPYGGVLETIAADAIAFPHRAGTLFNIQYQAVWTDAGDDEQAYMQWLRELYAFMAPYVSKNPRAAYVNYIDLDLGVAAGYQQAYATWGGQYFLANFPRLARVKARFDPRNVFSHPQGVPPYHYH